MDFIPDALTLSLQIFDERRRERALEEAQQREWPGVILEDVLDAETVAERTTCPVSPIIGLTNII